MLRWLRERSGKSRKGAEPRTTVLVCDDDHGVQEAYKLILSERYALKIVGSGRDAVKVLRRQAIPVMILDLKMPELDGLEVLRRVRESAPATRVIISTGYRSVETAQEAARLGCQDYLTKPFTPQDVLGAVEQALARQG